MEAPRGETVHALIEALEREPHGFSFFQAVRLLEQATPGGARVGDLGPAREEPVRLRPSSSLAFPSADLAAVERRRGEGPPYCVTTPILGLYGATTPLPLFYSEEILRREQAEDDDPARLFLDVLNHRLLSLLYRAWSKYRWEFTFEPGAADRLSQRMMGLLGLATEGLQEKLGIPAARLLRYAGTVCMRPRGAVAVGGVISDFFDGVPVRVEQCLARWVSIAEPDRNRVGLENSTLDQDLTVGERIRDRMGKCRIVIGPLGFGHFQAFLPPGEWFAPLGALVPFLLQDPLVYDLRLVLRGPEVPWLRLTGGPDAARLGWTSWLRHEPVCPDKGELFAPPPLPRAA